MFTEENDNLLPEVSYSLLHGIPDLIIDVSGVEKLLSNIDASKAVGPDGIPPWFLKMTASQLAPLLCDMFQTSIDTGEVPEDWKTADIAPIFKKGDRAEPANYRPVSLTSVICKLLEHIIHSHIMKFFELNNILSDNQHGFRAKRSTETQLILTIDDLAKALDSKKSVDVVVLDFTKAFDKVPHRRLMHKLYHLGIRGSLHTWICNFLSGRQQRVVIDGESSSPASVTSGVPQGTVLGPLLFLIYINDLPDKLTSQVRLFADDCLVYQPITSDEDVASLQNDLHHLESWQNDWLMHFNPSKCCTISFANRNPPKRQYKFCGEKLSSEESHPYLGIELHNSLNWNKQTQISSNKARKVLGVIRRNMWSCPEKVKSTAYLSLVRPHLEYAVAAWDPHTECNIKTLDRIQRQAARFCKRNYIREEGVVTKLLDDLQWGDLKLRRKIQRLSMLYKIHNSLVDISPTQYLTKNTRSTRGHQQKFHEIRTSKEVYRNSFFPQTIKDWNSLPNHVVNSQSTQLFKDNLSNHLFNRHN